MALDTIESPERDQTSNQITSSSCKVLKKGILNMQTLFYFSLLSKRVSIVRRTENNYDTLAHETIIRKIKKLLSQPREFLQRNKVEIDYPASCCEAERFARKAAKPGNHYRWITTRMVKLTQNIFLFSSALAYISAHTRGESNKKLSCCSSAFARKF